MASLFAILSPKSSATRWTNSKWSSWFTTRATAWELTRIGGFKTLNLHLMSSEQVLQHCQTASKTIWQQMNSKAINWSVICSLKHSGKLRNSASWLLNNHKRKLIHLQESSRRCWSQDWSLRPKSCLLLHRHNIVLNRIWLACRNSRKLRETRTSRSTLTWTKSPSKK